jgi:predicted dehydrogenase
MIKLGLVGVNTSHAEAFTRLLNGEPGGTPQVEGARIISVWGGPADDAKRLANTYGLTIVDDPRDMAASIDGVLVIDDTGGGASHAALARPFLEHGTATFIDKPMTRDLPAAIELFELAERRGTPLMSASALRYGKEADELRGRLASLGALSTVVSVGPGDWFYYGIHAVEQYVSLIGPGASWVQRFAKGERNVAIVGYDDGPTVVVGVLADAAYVFQLTAYGADAWARLDRPGDPDDTYASLMTAVVGMVRERRAPIDPRETIEILAVLHAGVRAFETGGLVRLSDVLPH